MKVKDFNEGWKKITFEHYDIVYYHKENTYNVEDFEIHIEKQYYILRKRFYGGDIIKNIEITCNYNCNTFILFNNKEYPLKDFIFYSVCTPYIPMYFIIKCDILPDSININYDEYICSGKKRRKYCSEKIKTNTNIYNNGKIINK